MNKKKIYIIGNWASYTDYEIVQAYLKAINRLYMIYKCPTRY